MTDKLSRRVEKEWNIVKDEFNSEVLYEGLIKCDMPECLAIMYQNQHEELMQRIAGNVYVKSWGKI